MADQFLQAHRVGPGLFEMSGLRTVSIRDQMLRAQLLVQRLKAEGLVDAQYPLLVVGSGAGGVTAALQGVSELIETYLCEQAGGAFGTQQLSERWMDPVQYDWPAEHWQGKVFPWRRPGSHLHWHADRASNLAARWETAFQLAVRQHTAHLHFSPNTLVAKHDIGVASTGARPAVTCSIFPGVRFGAAISCVGFGQEKTSASPAFVGFPFWGADPYDLPNLALDEDQEVRALVSGGGDGALQDFLRLTIGSVLPGDVIERINALGVRVDLTAILRADDEAHRACLWSPSGGDTHDVLQRWHNRYEHEVDRIWASMNRSQRAMIADNLVPEILSNRRRVTLAHGCKHFTFCYGLNRLVVLLVAYAYEDATGRRRDDILRWGSGLAAAKAVDAWHVCGDPAQCHGIEHEVTLDPHGCVHRNAGLQDRFNVVVVRHGVKFRPLFNAPPFPKQHIPYDLD